jgi:hypothetical protein
VSAQPTPLPRRKQLVILDVEMQRALDSRIASLFFSHFEYWSDKGSNPNGWIFKTAVEIERETGLTYREQQHARRILVKHGLIEERYQRLNHRMDFKVNKKAMQLFIDIYLSQQPKAAQVIDSTPTDNSTVPELTNEQMANVQTAVPETTMALVAPTRNAVGTDAKRSSYKEETTQRLQEDYLEQTPPTPSSPPSESVCTAEVIEAELIPEPTTALATIPEKPFLLRRSTKRELQPFQQQWFEEFWMVYPRKEDKKTAKETFARHVITQEIFDKTMEALHADYPNMLKKDEQYRKHPSTWLNTEPWDNPREANPPARTPDPSSLDRFALARLTRKERASIEFTKRVMREYGSTQCR